MRLRRRHNHDVTIAWPGTTAAWTVKDWPSVGGLPFALLHDARHQQVTVMFAVKPGADLDADRSDWARLWAGTDRIDLGDAGDVLALEVLWDQTTPELPKRLAVTFAVLTKAAKADLGEQAVDIGIRIRTLIDSLKAAGILVQPLTTTSVIELAAHAVSNELVEARALAALLAKASDTHDHVAMPRGAMVVGTVPATITHQTLVSLYARAARVTLCYRPVELPEHQDDRPDGERPDTDRPDSDRTVLARFGGVVTTSAHAGGLEALRTGLPVAGRLGLRRSFGSQAAFFAAGLGMGILLPDAADVPTHVFATNT